MHYKISVKPNGQDNQPAGMWSCCLKLELTDDHQSDPVSIEIVGWFRHEGGLFSNHLSIALPPEEARRCASFFQQVADSATE